MYIERLGLPTAKLNQLKAKGINTFQDLIQFLPRKYYDFTNPVSFSELVPGEVGCVIGVIDKVTIKSPTQMTMTIRDNKNQLGYVSFFHMNFLNKKFFKGDQVLIGGVMNTFGSGLRSFCNPRIFTKEIKKYQTVIPEYSSIKGMSADYLSNQIQAALSIQMVRDYLEPELIKKYKLLPQNQAYRTIHGPLKMEDLQSAKARLLFDDLFLFNYYLKTQSVDADNHTDVSITTCESSKQLQASIPFQLTMGQFNVLKNLFQKMHEGTRVNALVQGDVGCGKTLVAFFLMALACENGYQSVLVAPTSILAKQHYKEAKERLEPLGFHIGYLSGECKAKETRQTLKELADGTLDVVIGTHSLLTPKVVFSKLGLAIIDEEHRFGVNQREALSFPGVHKVSMSATPIPRSLAMSLYGDLIDVETITTLPKGRQPITTEVLKKTQEKVTYQKILEECKKGRQAYVVCPLIQKSESDKMDGVKDVEATYDECQKYFSPHGFQVGKITGDMKDIEVAEILERFRKNEFQILVATTIIEVGVNVPNASVITIQNAERFGFAGLHQLRGRVGRGNDAAFCYLVTDNTDKFHIFTKTRDGFEIAKEDLKLRGAGSFLSTEQNGNNRYLMLIMGNEALNRSIVEDIEKICRDEDRKKFYYQLAEIHELDS